MALQIPATQLRALQTARASLQTSPQAGATVRRVARALRLQAERQQATALALAAQAVEQANEAELLATLDQLLVLADAAVTSQPVQDPAVLVVDPDRFLADVFARAIRGCGCQVLQAYSAAEAQEMLLTHPVSVIVTEICLPDGDGRDLILGVKASGAHDVAVLVASQQRDPLVREECLALGADEFFYKPTNAQELATAVLSLHQRAQVRSTPICDPVTGLPTRSTFAARFEAIMSLVESARSSAVLALFEIPEMADHDGAARLEMQIAVSAVLHTFRDSDIVGRWASNQIVALLPFTDYRAGIGAVQKILQQAEKAPLRTAAGEQVDLTMSAMAVPVTAGVKAEEAVQIAEQLLALARPQHLPIQEERRATGVIIAEPLSGEATMAQAVAQAAV